jgi:chromosomal replication initiator protein DnaA
MPKSPYSLEQSAASVITMPPSTAADPAPMEDPERSAQADRVDLEVTWEQVRAVLRESIDQTPYFTWFQQAVLRSLTDSTLTIAVQNEFTRDWLLDNYMDQIEYSVHTVLSSRLKVEVVVDAELAARKAPRRDRNLHAAGNAAPPAENPSKNSAARQKAGLLRSSDVVLNPSYTFSNYVVGPCNRFAHAAAVGVSESPGGPYNPYFIHGSVGLGKTHLLQSLCRQILDDDPSTNILFLSCETFINHFIDAIGKGDQTKFRHKYRDVDVLVVDDIHLLANKERTQEEFFHTFNALYNAGKQIVLSSDSPPKDIPSLEERLVSRFKWGLVTEIEPPCYETRMAIIMRKASERGIVLPEDVTKILAERLDSNIRELEGAVNKLQGFSKLMGVPISMDLARQCLQDVFSVRRGPTSMDDIAQLVTEHFDVRLSELQSKKRHKSIAWPRQVSMYLTRRITKRSLQDIGGFYGGRDHSTVLHAIKKVEEQLAQDPGLQNLIADLETRLRRAALV